MLRVLGPSWDSPWAIAASSPSLPAVDLGSASSLRTILSDAVPGGCPRRRDSDGRWHLPLEAPRRPAAKAPLTPNPDPSTGRRVPTQGRGDAAGTAPMGATPMGAARGGGQASRQRDLRGRRSCPGRGGGRSADSPRGSRPVPGRRGRAAAGPRAQPSWRHRQWLRRRRDKTCQAGTAPAPPNPAPAPKCAHSQPVLPQPPQTCMFPVSLPKLSFRERGPAASPSPKQILHVLA